MKIRKNTGFTLTGFTLIELMIVLAIAGILAAITYPSMTTSIANNRVRSHSQDIQGILQFARSEAISRGETVTITPASNWQNGASLTIDGVEIKRLPPLSGNSMIASAGSLSFTARGLYNGGAITITHENASNSSTITIGSGGATSVATAVYSASEHTAPDSDSEPDTETPQEPATPEEA